MERTITALFFTLLLAYAAASQTIAVNPTGVNVNSQNPTTVFLTFGQIPSDYVPAEAIWCGELMAAIPPALGQQCRPDTIYGSLPLRFNRSTSSGNGGFTDIMTIPAAVVRRAYQAAVGGASAGFFYVRRFVSSTGGPDQYVNVTCRMTGGGARVPFALTNVELITPNGEPVLFIRSGEPFPKIKAEIRYNGTGRLKGRWEIVQPGEELPQDRDLLTEATLPIEQRGTQRRYTQIARFNHFLPPAGKFTLPLEVTGKMPLNADGQYLLVLRIEAVDDKESDSNLAAVGVGAGIVHSGAVASFPMPALRFFVQGPRDSAIWETNGAVLPFNGSKLERSGLLVFTWRELENAEIYRLSIADGQEPVFSAMLVSPNTSYRTPPWFGDRFADRSLTWSVTAFDSAGKVISVTRPISFDLR
jgi:hypothetical protein